MAIDYKKSGVDVEAGDSLVEWLQKKAPLSKHQEHLQKHTLDGIGGFASLFSLGFKKFQDPVLITCTDGVGTKVKIASQFNRYEGVGQDLVAMCVNDLICTGGEPVLFLDYYATGKLNLEHAKVFLDSVRKACHDSDCLLVGGETAEMPGVYQNQDFDCAGFAIGLVERKNIWGAHLVQEGDVLVGVSSSGFHSNGYSLVRKLFEKDLESYASQLLTPTHLYVKLVKAIQAEKIEVHAAAHVTGGGVDNLPRVIQADQKIKLKKWSWPEIFKEAQRRSQMSDLQMLKTFNCGIGFCFFAPSQSVSALEKQILAHGFEAKNLGIVTHKKEKSIDESSEIWIE